MFRKAISSVLLLSVCLFSRAQQLINDKIDVVEGSGVSNVNAVIYLPANYSTSKTYPLVIFTHGMGEAGTDINKLYNTGLPKVLKDGYKPSFEFIMVAPQRSSYSIDPSWLSGILEESQKRWSINANRIYLTGLSAGGWAAYGSQLNISSDLGKKFAAIVINSGATQDANKNNLDWWSTTKTPLWAVVGENDLSYAEQNKYIVSEINKRVSNLASITIRPGVGHGGWDDVYSGLVKNGTLTMWDWLYQFDRSNSTFPAPGSGTVTSGSGSSTDASTTVTTTTPTTGKAVPGRVEAESYDAMYGVQKENTYDAGGGQDIGWIGDGDWMDYNVSVATAGTYTITFRTATSASNGQIQLKKADGSILATVAVPQGTGGQDWKTCTATVSLSSGTQTLRVFASKGGWNFNWMDFASGGTTTTTSPTPTPTTTTTTTGAYANYTLTADSYGEIYRPNGLNISTLKPGDTININAGTYNLIDLGNFHGDATRPIIIRNRGGVVNVKQIRISNKADYFKFLGNGQAGVTYGFKVNGNNTTNGGFQALASDFEVGYIEVINTEAGFLIKKNPIAGDAGTMYPNYLMKNISIHHNYVHDVSGEAMYIGHTYPNGDPYDGGYVPIRLSNVEIAFNTINNSGWDGIQLSNATDGCKIHDNTITNFGTKNYGGQQAGIIMGANTTGDIYNNVIKTGTGNGLQVFGYGTINVYNNTIEDAGYDGTSIGQESIFCNDPISTVESRPKQLMNVYNNTIRNPKPKAAIRVAGYNGNTSPSFVQNNKILIVNAPVNWLSLYIFAVSGSTISGNTLL